jgi:hypothetical protein
MHDGSAPTLHDAILQHRGHAKGVTQRYLDMGAARADLLAFLQSLKAPEEAEPAAPMRSKLTLAR